MEPQIIDYYNQDPSMMKIIEKLNDEFEVVQKENEKLNQELLKYKNPKILYKNKIEWDQLKKEALLDLRKTLYLEIEYDMFGNIFNNTGNNFKNIISNVLKIITKNTYIDWVNYQSERIADCLNEKILTENNFFEFLYEDQTYADERFLADYFYKTILYYLNDNVKGILNKIVNFECKKCESIRLEPFKYNCNIKACDYCLKTDFSEYGGYIFIKNLGNVEVPNRNTKEEIINIISRCGIENAKEMFNIN